MTLVQDISIFTLRLVLLVFCVRNLSLFQVTKTRVLCYLLYEFPRAGCQQITNTDSLKTTEIYSVAVLEARSLKSRCWFPSGNSEGKSLPMLLFQLLVAIGSSWNSLAYRHILPVPASVIMWSSLHYLCVFSPSVAYNDICHWI
jgi:hypothetical protein